jgi:hypothetical protein
MAVYKGDDENEISATNAYNQALQTLAESSVPLAGGDYAATIRKNWPVGQMQFARGGYAGKGFVKPLAGAAEEAIATAKRLMTREPVPVRAPDPYVKGVNDRKPELQQAIKELYEGKITREQYDDVVRQVLPVEPYDFIPQPAPEHLAVDALNAAKKDKYGLNRDIYQEGDPVSLRLDIPAYTNLPNSQWVNSIHDTQGVHPTTYDSVSAARNVDFVVPENKARMTGEGGPKAPYAVMRGEYMPTNADDAVAKAREIMEGPLPSQWQQVGMDPRRHSYFYTRDDRMMPVTNADEVLQIGPVVYAKNPKVGEREDFGYARGGYAEGGDPEIENALRLAQEGSNPMEFVPNTSGPQQSPFDLRDQARDWHSAKMEDAAKRHGDWLISHGASPDIAAAQAEKFKNIPSDIAHTADEWLVPHSATDLALMAIPGGGPIRKAIGAGTIALDQMINPAEAGQGTNLKRAGNAVSNALSKAWEAVGKHGETHGVNLHNFSPSDLPPSLRVPQHVNTGIIPDTVPQTYKASDLLKKSEQLSENPVQISSAGKPLSDLEYKYTNKNDLVPFKVKTPEELQKEGAYVASALGDITGAGQLVHEINGVPLTSPVNKTGGGEFMRTIGLGSGENPAAFANRPPTASVLYNKMLGEVPEGSPLYLAHTLMGLPSMDSSHMMVQGVLRQIEALKPKIDPAVAEKLDETIRKSIPKWPGILNPEESERFLLGSPSEKAQPGTSASTVVQLLDTIGRQKGGLPDVGATRFAFAEPRLLPADQLASGFALSKVDPKKGVFQYGPTHETYMGKIPSVSGYEGGFEYQVPSRLMFPDFWNAGKTVDKNGNPITITNRQQALMTQAPVQKATQEWLDNIMKHWETEAKPWGYAEGGAVDGYDDAIDGALRLARGGYADGGIPMPNFAQQGPAIDIYSQVPGAGSFSFNPAKPTTVDNIPSGQQGPSVLPSPYKPTPTPEPAPTPVENASNSMPEPGGGGGGNGGDGGMGGTSDGGSQAGGGGRDSNNADSTGTTGGNAEKRGGRIWPKNNTGDNAVRLAHMIHHEMRSDPLFEHKIQSILSRL